jgi:glutamyl-tRNA synthetase
LRLPSRRPPACSSTATPIDYDYLITKKLKETDDVKDFSTPVTEYRQDVLADANVCELKGGDII